MMISEAFFIYLFFQIFTVAINIMGYTKLPALSIFGIGIEIAIMIPTITAFASYELVAVMLILMNFTLPIYALNHNMRG
jgi:hypothetical protein